jgi:hypothetical protein
MASEIDETALSRDFERAYNSEVDLSALSERERVAFTKLFDILGLYRHMTCGLENPIGALGARPTSAELSKKLWPPCSSGFSKS